MTQTPNNAGAPPPPQPPPPAAPGGPIPPVPPGGPQLVGPENEDARSMAMLCHLLGILTFFLGPLIIWLMKKDQSSFVNQQGKEVVNFELTMMIGLAAGVATICVLHLGGLILTATGVVNLVFGILGTVAVNGGQAYRFPLCIRFIK